MYNQTIETSMPNIGNGSPIPSLLNTVKAGTSYSAKQQPTKATSTSQLQTLPSLKRYNVPIEYLTRDASTTPYFCKSTSTPQVKTIAVQEKPPKYLICNREASVSQQSLQSTFEYEAKPKINKKNAYTFVCANASTSMTQYYTPEASSHRGLHTPTSISQSICNSSNLSSNYEFKPIIDSLNTSSDNWTDNNGKL